MNAPVAFPLISIVMATYNGALYLRQQLASVLAQTYPNLQLIITDDGSTDETVAIVQEYAQRDSRIQLMINQSNVGYVKNFERGCAAAKGGLIALCDQDDWWHPQKIEKLQAAIGNASIIYSDSELCDENLQPIGRLSERVNCLNFYNCMQQAIFCRIYGHTMLMKKEFVQKAMPFLPAIPHDWWLSFVATVENGAVFYPEVLSQYRQHSNNVFGAVGGKTRTHNKADTKAKKQKEIANIRARMQAFYERCPAERKTEKAALQQLWRSYQNFSLPNNFLRMATAFRYRRLLLSSKKRSGLRQYLFCLKMFFIIK